MRRHRRRNSATTDTAIAIGVGSLAFIVWLAYMKWGSTSIASGVDGVLGA